MKKAGKGKRIADRCSRKQELSLFVIRDSFLIAVTHNE